MRWVCHLLLACGLLAALPAASPAAIVTYTSQAAFLAAVQPGYYLETFESYSTGSAPTSFSGNGFSYQASSPNGTFVVGPIPGSGQSLSERNFFPLNFDQFAGPGPVTAVGGFFFPNSGNTVDGSRSMSVVASNGVDTSTVTLTAPVPNTSFVGFVSTTGAFTSLSASVLVSGGPPNPDVNDLIVGTAAANAVPAPAGLVLLGLGLPALGLVRRARRA